MDKEQTEAFLPEQVEAMSPETREKFNADKLAATRRLLATVDDDATMFVIRYDGTKDQTDAYSQRLGSDNVALSSVDSGVHGTSYVIYLASNAEGNPEGN